MLNRNNIILKIVNGAEFGIFILLVIDFSVLILLSGYF